MHKALNSVRNVAAICDIATVISLDSELGLAFLQILEISLHSIQHF